MLLPRLDHVARTDEPQQRGIENLGASGGCRPGTPGDQDLATREVCGRVVLTSREQICCGGEGVGRGIKDFRAGKACGARTAASYKDTTIGKA